MTSTEIQAKLRLLGYSQSMLAEASGVSVSLISKVIHRKATSQNVASIIANAIDAKICEVFPEYIQKNLNKAGSGVYDTKLIELRAKLNRGLQD